jgi:hypothetical protein
MVDFTTFASDPHAAPFDVNASPPVKGAALPRPSTLLQGLIVSPDTYTIALAADAGSDPLTASFKAVGDSIAAACKALAIPPRAYSYASMSFMPDTAAHGLIQWPGINPDSLRKVSRENIIPRMVFNARVNDIARYADFARYPWQTGWTIGLRDPSSTPTSQDRADIREATSFVMNCCRDSSFDPDAPADPRGRDAHRLMPFDTFLRASTDDMMTFDAWAIWTDRTRRGGVNAFTCLPAGNVRLANPATGYRNDPSLFAALLDETGNPVAGFTRDDLIWRVQSPRTDPSTYGYGWPLIEQSVRVIQAFQSAVDLNASTFDKSGIPNAILKLTGEFFNQDQIDAMMREWNNMKKGISKTWGLPVIAIPEDGDIELLNLNDIKGMDVRYKDHMNMMAGIWCVIAGFPIRRMGFFASGHSRDNMPVPDQSVEIQGVDDPGLPPLLSHIEATLNPYIIQANWPRLALYFYNKDPKSDARGYEARKLARTWGESRVEVDQPVLADLAKGPKAWLKPLMEMMDLAPEDSAKMSGYFSLGQQLLVDRLKREAIDDGYELDPTDPPDATAGDRTPAKTPGAAFPSKKDPAASQEHGHRAGVRRTSPTTGRSSDTSNRPHGGATTRGEDSRQTGGGRTERRAEASH